MGRRFILSGENMTLGTGNVLAALQTAAALTSAGGMIKLLRCEINQSHNTTSAQVRADIAKRNTAGTLTVTGATPQPLALGGPASGIASGTSPLTAATAGVNSSADTGGTYTEIWPIAPNNQAGLLWLPTPDEQIYVPPSTVVVVRLLATPADTAGWNVTLVFEEVF
jgi:hypothetical protein